MKKQLLAMCVLALLFGALFAVPAKADLLYEPMRNNFYRTHSEEMKQEDHLYVFREGRENYTLYVSPVSEETVGTLPAGKEVRGTWSYVDAAGTEWIIVYTYLGEGYTNQIEGWVPAVCLLRVYDSDLFEAEHKDEIREESGFFEAGEERRTTYFYLCPGSTNVEKGSVAGDIAYQQVYTDAFGRRWIPVHYYEGIKGRWICMDDPGADPETLYADGKALDVDKRSKEEGGAAPVGDVIPAPVVEKPTIPWYIFVIVGGTVLLAALALVFIKIRGKKKAE